MVAALRRYADLSATVYDGSSDVVGRPLYYTTDANHNVTAVTTPPACAKRYAYTAYGEVTVYDVNWQKAATQTSSVGNTRLFAGMDLDPLTGAYDDNARWYNYTTGTFVNRDPIAADLNLYRYVLDNPANTVDPTGEAACVIVDSSLSVELDPKKPCSVKGKNNFYNPSYVRCSVACNFFVRMMNESIGYKIHQEFPIGPGRAVRVSQLSHFRIILYWFHLSRFPCP